MMIFWPNISGGGEKLYFCFWGCSCSRSGWRPGGKGHQGTPTGRCFPTSARWSRSTTGPSLGHRHLRPTDRDLRVTPARCGSHHRATTAEQPYGVYDIGYYESPYETFFCYDYGAD